MITKEKYQEIKARNDAFELWRNGRTSYKVDEVPADVPKVTNEERGEMELFEFVTNPPEQYFLYVSEESKRASAWPGNELGTVYFGASYKCPAFGTYSTRVPITVIGVNGVI